MKGLQENEKIKGLLILGAALLIPVLIILNYGQISKYEWGQLGYAGIFAIMFITSATVILPLPGLAAATIAGAFANPLLIGIVGGLGSATGEMTGYMAGYGGSKILDGKGRKHYVRIKEMLTEKGRAFILIFLFALIPNPLFDLAGLAAGTIRYPPWKFFIACALGKIIKVAAFAYFGYLAADTII